MRREEQTQLICKTKAVVLLQISVQPKRRTELKNASLHFRSIVYKIWTYSEVRSACSDQPGAVGTHSSFILAYIVLLAQFFYFVC